MKPFPFNLSGPGFLFFYFALAIVAATVLGGLFRWRERPADGAVPRIDDPYKIAILRAGPNEAIRLATFSLLDRRLLAQTGATLRTREGAGELAHRPIERAILRLFASGRDAADVYEDARVALEAKALQRQLEKAGLLSDPTVFEGNPRAMPAAIVLALLLGIAAMRAVLSGPPLIFLGLLALLATFMIWKTYGARVTGLGRETLAHLQTLFARLNARAATLKAGGESSEVVLLAAVFGFAALPGALVPDLPALKSKKDGGSGCGSGGCGSSGGGGGGDGGGGCGGCGGGCGG